MPSFLTLDSLTRSSTFAVAGGCAESFLSIATPAGVTFSDALTDLDSKYASALDRHGLSDATAIFCRIFLSDILNQKSALLDSALFRRLRGSCALSVIEQKSLDSGPVSLLAYHIGDPQKAFTKRLTHSRDDVWRNDLVVTGGNYSLILTANHTSDETSDAYTQTKAVFDSLNSTVEQQGMSLLGSCIRTWVYVRDIDNNYKEMVRARREFFAEHGLCEKTRYLASTGILGMAHSPERIVSVDSLSVGGLAAEQIVRMEALSHLWSTILYGVTFERGLRLRFGDRSHLHISGTASINTKGDVLHEGDAEAQSRRAVDNARALLGAQSATLEDLVYVIAYVRNAHDARRVRQVLDEELGCQVPLVVTEAAVCRPAWLMEIEGIAIIPDRTEFPPFP